MRKRVFFILFSILPFLGFTEPSVAQLLTQAKQGDSSAQFELAMRYGSGEGVAENEKEAVKWFRLAAQQGLADAQYALGLYYDEGPNADWKEAEKWYRLAAAQGIVDAQFELGCHYAPLSILAGEDFNANSDIEEAVRWFKPAAEQGHAGAQLRLGDYYYDGIGVPRDKKQAVKWLRLAAEQKDLSPKWASLAEMRWSGLALFDDKMSLEFSRFRAERGEPDAQYMLGLRYSEGDGVSEDDREAVKWYRLAAEQGHALAQCNLGFYYSNGQGVLEDYVEAYAWYVIAAMNGSEQAAKNKDICKKQLHSVQIAAGQERAKELMAMIDRKKQVAELGEDDVPAADIAPSGFGSGLLVDGGYVLTCWHVVNGGDKISISCGDKDYAATVVRKDPANDIAVLRVVDAPAGVPLSLADFKLGANVFTMGFPHPDLQGSDVKFTTGSISGLTGPGNTPVYYQISVPLQSGNSGGPLFDEQGNLVGMVAAKLDSLVTLAATGDLPQNVNYAIKADYLKPLLKTVDGISIQPAQTKPVNLLSLVEELKKSVVMIKVY